MRTRFLNAQVYTGQLPLQQAFIIEKDRFLFVGTNEDALTVAADLTIDLRGAFVCAGFNDSHMHLLNYGQALSIAPLADHTGSMQDMLDCMRIATPGQGGWIMGRGWNQDLFQDANRMPNRWDLDKVSVKYPVCAVRACGHALSVNSKALSILGVTEETKQPDGGQIVLENGQPNGVFLDNAMDIVLSAIPAPDKDDVKAMLKNACIALNRYGITSCQTDDYCVFQKLSWQTVNEALSEMEKNGELTVRVYEQANFTSVEKLAEFLQAGNVTGSGTDMFRIGPLKLLGDGALGARTAYLRQPYADDPTTCGLSIFSPEEFDALIGYANAHEMQIAVHCIGDACLELVLNSFEKALAAHPRKDHRHGIVHCQITGKDQLERLAKNRLHIYAQNIFLDYDIHIVEQRVGKDLAESSYSWKTLQSMGCTVSNGSDCPVEAPDVLAGIQCAVTRCDLNGVGPYLPQEAFSVKEALDSFTSAGAYSSFEEKRKGKIQKDMLADFVVLAQNPFHVPADQLKHIPVLQTWLAGTCVFPVTEKGGSAF